MSMIGQLGKSELGPQDPRIAARTIPHSPCRPWEAQDPKQQAKGENAFFLTSSLEPQVSSLPKRTRSELTISFAAPTIWQ